MKSSLIKTAYFICFIFLTSAASAQSSVIGWMNWTDSASFERVKHTVAKTGLSHFSDTLSENSNGWTFFESNGVYFRINSAADYYLWYINKYPEEFSFSYQTYAELYKSGEKTMMTVLIDKYFLGDDLPLNFVAYLDLEGREIRAANRRLNRRLNEVDGLLKQAQIRTMSPHLAFERQSSVFPTTSSTSGSVSRGGGAIKVDMKQR